MAAKRPVLVVAAVGTVVALGVLAFRGGGDDSPVITRAGAPPPAGPAAVPAPATAAAEPALVSADHPTPDAPRPAQIAAIEGGSVVVLDPADGHRLRTLATHPEATTGGFPYLEGVSQSPDHSQVFYALAGDCGPATIFRVAADGRTPGARFADGVSPAVSPDGRKLAYAVAGPDAGPESEPTRHCQNEIVVRDLQSGAERTWRYPDTPDYGTPLYHDAVIGEISWAPDSTRLAYTLSYEGDSVSILDTGADNDLSQTEEVVVPSGGGNSSHPAWQGYSGLLGLFNTRFECCFDDNYTGPPRALLVNPERRLDSPLLPPGRRVTALDFDASGTHLLFIDGGRLYRRSGTQAPVPLVTGVTAADW
jgi:WD40-like Beta Propeller Repeat